VRTEHPSALSKDGIRRTKPFSRANEGLRRHGEEAIDWRL
jgi:uracil DNA glycosylase